MQENETPLSVARLQQLMSAWKSRHITDSTVSKLLRLYLGLTGYMNSRQEYPLENFYDIRNSLRFATTQSLVQAVKRSGSFLLDIDEKTGTLKAFRSPLYCRPDDKMPAETPSELPAQTLPQTFAQKFAQTFVQGHKDNNNNLIINNNYSKRTPLGSSSPKENNLPSEEKKSLKKIFLGENREKTAGTAEGNPAETPGATSPAEAPEGNPAKAAETTNPAEAAEGNPKEAPETTNPAKALEENPKEAAKAPFPAKAPEANPTETLEAPNPAKAPEANPAEAPETTSPAKAAEGNPKEAPNPAEAPEENPKEAPETTSPAEAAEGNPKEASEATSPAETAEGNPKEAPEATSPAKATEATNPKEAPEENPKEAAEATNPTEAPEGNPKEAPETTSPAETPNPAETPEETPKEAPDSSTDAAEFFHRINMDPEQKARVLVPLIDRIQQEEGTDRPQARRILVCLVNEQLIPYFAAHPQFPKITHEGRIIWLGNLLNTDYGGMMVYRAARNCRLARAQDAHAAGRPVMSGGSSPGYGQAAAPGSSPQGIPGQAAAPDSNPQGIPGQAAAPGGNPQGIPGQAAAPGGNPQGIPGQAAVPDSNSPGKGQAGKGSRGRAEGLRDFRPISPYEWTDRRTDQRFYDDREEGLMLIPADAPPRPAETALWNVLSKQWIA